MTQEQACQLLGKLAEFWPQWHVAKMLAAHLSDAKAETDPGLLTEWRQALEELESYEIAEQAARHIWRTGNYPTPARVRDAYRDIARRRRQGAEHIEPQPPQVWIACTEGRSQGWFYGLWSGGKGQPPIEQQIEWAEEARQSSMAFNGGTWVIFGNSLQAVTEAEMQQWQKEMWKVHRPQSRRRFHTPGSPAVKAEAAPEGMGAWVRRKLAEVKP